MRKRDPTQGTRPAPTTSQTNSYKKVGWKVASDTYAAPHAEPALPDGERPPPRAGHLVPAREVVVRARADDAERDAPDGDAEDEVPVAPQPPPANAGQRGARGD